MPDYALSVGLTSQQGAVIGAMLSLGLGIGRPIVGWISDEFGRINIASAMTGLCGVFCFLIWIFAKQFSVLCLFAFVAGMVCGTYWSTIVPVCGEVVGMKDLSNALGISFTLMMFPTTCKSSPTQFNIHISLTTLKVAEAIALQLRRSSGNIYLPAQLFTGSMFILAALCSWDVRSWKINDDWKRAEMRAYREDARDGGRLSWERRAVAYAAALVCKGKV